MRRSAIISASVAATLIVGAPTAMAASWSGGRTGSYASGSVTIGTSSTTLSGRVYDQAPDGSCASFKGEWDYMWEPNIVHNIARACGHNTSQYGSDSFQTRSGARDFEIRVCTGGNCSIVWEGDGNDA